VPDGIKLMRRNASVASRRVFQRGGGDYYEYRDTAMSRVAMIRPEWIKMLHSVDDVDPDNPTVRWNNGHFLFQFTYFVGEVNYYYGWQGQRFCEPMNTGDSVFGMPFARHSFASRNSEDPGLILALTYGGRLVGDAQHELGVLGNEAAGRFVLPLDGEAAAHGALLRSHLRHASYTAAHLAAAAGLDRDHLDELLEGRRTPDAATLRSLADALRVSPRELVPTLPDTDNGVVVVKHDAAPWWLLPEDGAPSYRLRRLAGSRVTPFSKSLEVEVLADGDTATLEVGLHQYGYNPGRVPVDLAWEHGGETFRARVEPEDSFYVKPWVRHRFSAPQPSAPGSSGDPVPKLLLLRVGGKVVGDVALEASLVGGESLNRVVSETMCWYDAGAAVKP